MTVVEAYVGRKRINPLGDSWQLHPVLSSLLVEGIAQNTIGNVFVPKVSYPLFCCYRIWRGLTKRL
jgi:Ca2+-transporting ATPase